MQDHKAAWANQATSLPSRRATARSAPGLTAAQARQIYRTMLLSRRLDDMEIVLKQQNEIYFQISGAGHEASLAAACLYLKPGHDWFFPYYRDRALCLGLGVSPTNILLQAVGAADDPASGGRQMPSHWSSPAHHIVSEASPTGTQFLTAVGCAEAGLLQAQGLAAPKAAAAAHRGWQGDEVVYCSAGEGATSQGFFHEALNTACLGKLPVLFHIEDNGYAISTPVSQQTAGGNITALCQGYPGLLRLEFDGCDPSACALAWRQAVDYARARRGPVLLHAHVVRSYSHSLSDDERAYRPKQEIDAAALRDPLRQFVGPLKRDFGLDAAALQTIAAEVEAELELARAAALAAPSPDPSSARDFVYSPQIDPTGPAFHSPSEAAPTAPADRTMVDLLGACMRDEMERQPQIVVFGQDVADVADSKLHADLPGKGGVFKVTHGLQRRFGDARVFNSPLSESNIVGRAIGMAVRGLKPVVEIQFFDYIWPAMMHIRSEMALMRWRSANGWSCPMVIRAPYGGYLKGGAIFHSQTGESIFTHMPGLRVVLPSNALDANGLLRTAMRCDDPVLFLEHKHLYRQTHNRAAYPGPNYMVPFGKAARLLSGDRLTLITYGALVKRSMDAAMQAKAKGIHVDLLDLRTLAPYDWEGIADSVKRTGKVLIVHEETRSWGYGAEIAARIGDELFGDLDGPLRRLASMDTFVGYHPALESAILPQTEDVLREIEALAAY
jgi:2-oxoisovalerate dehydrogenase E1 component